MATSLFPAQAWRPNFLSPLSPASHTAQPSPHPPLHPIPQRPSSRGTASASPSPLRPSRPLVTPHAPCDDAPRVHPPATPNAHADATPPPSRWVPPISSTSYLPFFLPAPARIELFSLLFCGPPRLGRPTVQLRPRHLLLEAEFRARDHAKPLRDPLPPRSGPSETAAAILAVAFQTEAAKISA